MLKQRIITALVLGPLAIAGVFLLPATEFAIFIGLVLTIAAWEWGNFARFDGAARFAYAGLIAVLMVGSLWLPAEAVLVVGLLWWIAAFVFVLQYPARASLWSGRATLSLLGILVLVPGFVSLQVLKRMPDSNFLILLLFLLIWGADIGAYFTGRAFGRAKLAPAVSPGKSWAGVYGGIVTAALIAAGMALWFGKPALDTGRGLLFLGLCSFVVIVSVLGDLTLSMFKRNRGIKDSSSLLPGHGGVLDRIDSLLSAGPLFAFFMLWFGWN
ncbi:MAG: phosphatidate cytidylyltransferase [Pseudomonadota bacterium]